jgi:hypothetical protein
MTIGGGVYAAHKACGHRLNDEERSPASTRERFAVAFPARNGYISQYDEIDWI